MNLFSRVFVILICLALATLSISVATLAWAIPDDSLVWLRDAIDWMDDNDNDASRAILAAGAVGVALLALIVVVLELMPRSSTHVKVTDLKVGDAVLSTAAIAQRVEEAVAQVPHVVESRAFVKAKRKGVLVTLDLHVDPDANLAAVTDEACQAARDVLTERVHVALEAPPSARLHYRELRFRGSRTPVRKPASRTETPPEAATAEPEIVATPVPPPASGEEWRQQPTP